MKQSHRLSALLLFLIANAVSNSAYSLTLPIQEKERHPIPSPRELRTAEVSINRIYFGSKQVNDSTMLRKIASEMLSDARTTKDNLAARYQLLTFSSNIYIQLHDVQGFEKSCIQLCEDFDENLNSSLSNGLKTMAKNVRDIDIAKNIADAARKQIERCMQNRQFDDAKKFLTTYQNISRRIGDKNMQSACKELQSEISKKKTIVGNYKAALKLLEQQPDSAEGNHKAGLYFGIVEKNYEEAISHLKKGTDSQVIALFEESINKSEMEIAFECSKLGKNGQKDIEKVLLGYSHQLLKRLTSELTGISRKKCVTELERIESLISADLGKSDLAVRGAGAPKEIVLRFLIKSTDKKFIVAYDSVSKNYAVALDQESDIDGKKDASWIAVDGKRLEDTSRKTLSESIADGKEHLVEVGVGEAMQTWQSLSWDGMYPSNDTSWRIDNGYIRIQK